MSIWSRTLGRIFGSRPASPPPRPRPPLIRPEDRNIDDLVFCGERHPNCADIDAAHPGLPGAELIKRWNETHAIARANVRATLRACGVEKAGDINTLGCTGAAKAKLTIEAIANLRLDLAGSGFGLPCFVPPSRYCLAHNTIGGLQDGQKAHHEEMVESISRELTPEEKGHMVLTEAARHARGDERMLDAHGALTGFELPKGFEKEGDPS